MSLSIVYALLGVAISVGLSAIGSSIGSGLVGKVGAALLSKQPEKFSQILILTALPSTQMLYGLLFGFLILVRTNLIVGRPADFSVETGMSLMLSAVPLAIACLISGIMQGQVAASAVRIVAEKPESATQGVVLATLIESFAVFGLIISLLTIFVGIQI